MLHLQVKSFFGVIVEILTIIVSVAFTAFVSWSLLDAGVLHGNYKKFFGYVKKLRPIMFVTNFPIQILTIVVGYILNSVVGLSWGWTSFLHADGSTSNINMIGFSYIWFAPVFAILIILALPHLAHFEEMLFRKNTRGIGSAIIRSLVFGMIHMTAGISLGYALALSVGGLWFSYQYKKGGVERSTSYHLAWNYMFVFLLLAAIAYSLI